VLWCRTVTFGLAAKTSPCEGLKERV
jgi:hypothetical protein